MSLKILINGCKGRMGGTLMALAPKSGIEIAAAVDEGDDPSASIGNCDVVIDFSFHCATAPLVRLAAEAAKPMVIGTTGHSEEERAEILNETTRIPVIWAGNFSIGVNLLFHLTKRAASILGPKYHAEITELHHALKVDAPSGTAEMLVTAVREGRSLPPESVRHGRTGIVGVRPDDEIGVHALRGGDVVGEHTVFFAGHGERVELRHVATDREIFARGALNAARWVAGKSPGLYGMDDVLGISSAP
jgi:4-hydroxy-tetrahydrodipicolinate reductase